MKTTKLIQEHNKKFSTYYQGDLYSHTPMALVALSDMGATNERLDEYFEYDIEKLGPMEISSLEINEDNWKNFIGNQQAEDSYISFFKEEVEKYGVEGTLKKYFDQLIPGVAAAAFHPIIRLSYAIQTSNKHEVATSLGTWAASYLDLGVDSKLKEEKNLLEILHDLDYDFLSKEEIKLTGNIASRIKIVSTSEVFKTLSSQIKLAELTASKLEDSCLWLFSQTNDFTLLHAVTSHDAFERAISFSNNEDRARSYYWKALLAAYMTVRAYTNIDLAWEYPKIDLPTWSEVKQEALKSNDNHVVKLVHIMYIKDRDDLEYERKYAACLKLGIL